MLLNRTMVRNTTMNTNFTSMTQDEIKVSYHSLLEKLDLAIKTNNTKLMIAIDDLIQDLERKFPSLKK